MSGPASFFAEGFGWVQAGQAQRGNETGDSGYKKQQQRDAQERPRIRRADAPNLAFEQPRGKKREHDPPAPSTEARTLTPDRYAPDES